jgi:phage regulator Rha-like protein
MSSDFKIDIPFDTKPPRLKELVNKALMGEVWIRDTPFGPVTDSIIVASKFGLTNRNVLRAISKVHEELGETKKFKIDENFIESHYMAGPKGREKKTRKVDITEFGLVLLLLYLNSPKARQISAEILYRFFVLKTYVDGLTVSQIGAIKGYYRKQMKESIK